jgi:phage terminase large subunit-like protein
VELCQRYNVVTVLDPGYGMQRSMELVQDRGVPVVPASYSPARLIGATGTFDRFLREGKLVHDGDGPTRSHVLSAIKKVGTQGEHYLGSDRTRGIIALAMAAHHASAYQPTPIVVLPTEGIG